MGELRVAATSDNNETYMYYSAEVDARWAELKAWVEESKYVDIPVKWIIGKMQELEG